MQRRQRLISSVLLSAAALTLMGTTGSSAAPPPANDVTYEGFYYPGVVGVGLPMIATAPQPSPLVRPVPGAGPTPR